MRPSTCIPTDHVASMPKAIEVELVIAFLCDVLVADTDANPFQVVGIDPESKGFNIVRES